MHTKHNYLDWQSVRWCRFPVQWSYPALGRPLERIEILSSDESAKLCILLDQLSQEFGVGNFILDERYEDGHSAIESFLTERAGSLGAKVHTGRSRNDQVAVATRLFMKDCLNQAIDSIAGIAWSCLSLAEQHAQVPMPGYTHLQRAVPSSVGLWVAGFAEAFTDNLVFTRRVLELIDSSPLGTAAGYGVNLPEQYTTGSSIMPNKSNPDVVKLLRGRAATVDAAIVEIQATLSLPSGYQRDLQLTKAPLIRGTKSALQAVWQTPAGDR